MRVFLNIWAAVGPLVGVALGSWLATKSQRKHWLLDNKRAEYRKLLATLAACRTRFAMIYGVGPIALSPSSRVCVVTSCPWF
jgi:hypothetical protein